MSDRKQGRTAAYLRAVGRHCSLALCGTVSVLIFALVGVMGAFGAPESWQGSDIYGLYITAAVAVSLVVLAAVLLKLFDKKIGAVDNVLLIGLMSAVLVFVDLCIVGFSGAALVAWLVILILSVLLAVIRILCYQGEEEKSSAQEISKANAGFKGYCKEFARTQNILLLIVGAALLFGFCYAFSSMRWMSDLRQTPGALAIVITGVVLLVLCFFWAFLLRLRRKRVNGFDGVLFLFDLAFIATSFELLSVTSPTRIALFVVCLVVLAVLSVLTVRSTRLETAEEHLVESKGGFVSYYRALAKKYDLVLWLVLPIAAFFLMSVLDAFGILGSLSSAAGVSRTAVSVVVCVFIVVALAGLFFGLRSRKIGLLDLFLYAADVLIVLLLILQCVTGFNALKTTLWAVGSAACILLTIERFRMPSLFVETKECDEPVAQTEAAEEPSAEAAAPAAEAAAEEPAPLAEPAAETASDEPAEEPAAEAAEEPVESAPEAAAEPAAVIEEPAAEPAEEVAEEPVAEEAVEESVSAEAEEAPAEAAAAEAPAAETRTAFAFAGSVPARKDAELKFRLLSDPVKGYYSEIKNALLSFGLRARMSRTCEKFNKKGASFSRLNPEKPIRTHAILQVRGKSLCLYLNLDPASIEAKYFAKDVSDVKRFADTPAFLRIRSARAAKHAVELIARLAEQEGFRPKRRFSPTDYVPMLSAEGLTTFEKNGYGYLISDTARLADVRKLDDALAIKNISADPEVELAERFIRSRITVKEIADAFAAGSTVTIADLREREMITSNANYLIVTESEALSGRYTVVANEFTPDAAKLIQVAGGEAVKKSIRLIEE